MFKLMLLSPQQQPCNCHLQSLWQNAYIGCCKIFPARNKVHSTGPCDILGDIFFVFHIYFGCYFVSAHVCTTEILCHYYIFAQRFTSSQILMLRRLSLFGRNGQGVCNSAFLLPIKVMCLLFNALMPLLGGVFKSYAWLCPYLMSYNLIDYIP